MNIENMLDFFLRLKENNHREWFQAHKKGYDAIKSELNDFTKELIVSIRQFDPTVGMLEPKDCIFRINRDIRFSNDKSPYKTHTGIFVARGGKKSPFGGYYLHLEPGASFAGGGVYAPMPETLKALRMEIFHNYSEFVSILENKDFVKVYGGLSDMGKTTRVPQGFPPDFPGADVLKHKHFVAGHNMSDSDLLQPGLSDKIIHAFRTLHPLVVFLNRGVEDIAGGRS